MIRVRHIHRVWFNPLWTFVADCERLIDSHLLSEIGNHIAKEDIYENRAVILPYLLEACETGEHLYYLLID